MELLKTIRLGVCKTPGEYRKRLKRARHTITEGANNILDKISCSGKEIELDLVAPDLCELGFKKDALHRYKHVCAKAMEMGLELCPDEVGPALRLQFRNNYRRGWSDADLRIAMKPIAGRAFSVSILCYGYGDNQWQESGLATKSAKPNDYLHANECVVFVRPRTRSKS